MEGAERRRHQRFQLAIPACLRAEGPDAEPCSCQVVARDISSWGAWFAERVPFAEGAHLHVDLTLAVHAEPGGAPSLNRVDLKARMVRGGLGGTAVEFVDGFQNVRNRFGAEIDQQAAGRQTSLFRPESVCASRSRWNPLGKCVLAE